MTRTSIVYLLALAATLIGSAGDSALAEQLSGKGLVAALHQGGYVLAMRHTSSPTARPSADAADPENTNRERQLDQVGRDTARGMGEALKKLGIPLGAVLSSPTYRALETVRLAAFGHAEAFAEIGDGGQSMQKISEPPAEWLRHKAAEPPRAGTDTIIITHMPNLVAAFGDAAKGVEDGEAMVFRPDGKGATELVARVKVEEWPALASQ
jgi:phosphohistidine phosphatase SixA